MNRWQITSIIAGAMICHFVPGGVEVPLEVYCIACAIMSLGKEDSK